MRIHSFFLAMQVYNMDFKLTSVCKQPSNRYFWGGGGK